MYNNIKFTFEGEMLKRVFAIHDMSGIGKCSLSAAIPIISALGVECNPIPTAILSSHTGEMEGYTFRDLTDDLTAYVNHWKTLDIKPDCIYIGYLASLKQIETVKYIINSFADSETLFICDPAMADSGRLYTGFDDDFVSNMAQLCKTADIITPNLTEAALITKTEYKPDADEEYLNDIIEKLKEYTKRYIVLTGVNPDKSKTGCLIYDKLSDKTVFLASEKYPGTYYGTGDIFTSVLCGCTVNGIDIFRSAEIALEFTSKSVKETYINQTDTRFGLAFEKFIPLLTEVNNELR